MSKSVLDAAEIQEKAKKMTMRLGLAAFGCAVAMIVFQFLRIGFFPWLLAISSAGCLIGWNYFAIVRDDIDLKWYHMAALIVAEVIMFTSKIMPVMFSTEMRLNGAADFIASAFFGFGFLLAMGWAGWVFWILFGPTIKKWTGIGSDTHTGDSSDDA